MLLQRYEGHYGTFGTSLLCWYCYGSQASWLRRTTETSSPSGSLPGTYSYGDFSGSKPSSAALPSQPSPTCPGMAPPTEGQPLLHQSAITKMLRQTCPRANLMKSVPQLGFRLPGCTMLTAKVSDHTLGISIFKHASPWVPSPTNHAQLRLSEA